MAKREVLAVLSVDDKLKEMEGGSIEKALGGCLDSGITLVKCCEIPDKLILPRVGYLEKFFVDRYTLCVSNGMYIFDGDLEELFDHSEIAIKETKKIADWDYDKDGEIVGVNEGELLDIVCLEQYGKLFECNVYAQNGGCGLDYALDLKNINPLTHVWKDIVKVNGEIYAEEYPISGQKDGSGDEKCYKIDDFLAAVAQKYGVNTDEIQTYMMDNIEFNPETLPYGAESCGCYINGVPEWIIDSKKEEEKVSYTIKSIEEDCGEEYFTLLVPANISKETIKEAIQMAVSYAMHHWEYIPDEEAEDFDEYYEKMNSISLGNGQETFNYYLEKCRGWEIKSLAVDFWYEW